MTARDLRIAAATGLALVTALSSLLGLVALNAGGAARLGPLNLFQAAAGYDRRAQTLLDAPAPSADAQAKAASLSRQALSQYPFDTGAWLRLAYLDVLRHGALTPGGVEDLQRSYDLVAVDPDFGLWRIRFALENSQALPPELRQDVRREVKAFWAYGSRRRDLKQLLGELDNPSGRLSLALWLNRLQAHATE